MQAFQTNMEPDPEMALLTLEAELGATEIKIDDVPRLMEVVVVAARAHDGYSGAAWKAGARLASVAKQFGRAPDLLFEQFGWRALATGVQAALQDNKFLSALSYATIPFLPPPNSTPVFDHPQIIEAFRAGLDVTPTSFVDPSGLGIADPVIQAQFGELLTRLPYFPVQIKSETYLQWSASALRVLPVQSAYHRAAAISLLDALCKSKRPGTTYYVFRGLVGQHQDLWQHPLVLTVLYALIEQYRQDEATGVEILAQLCTDDDILRRFGDHFDLLVVIGGLAIYLAQRYKSTGVETAAWHLVNEVYRRHPLVGVALGEYLTNGALPSLPTPKAERLESLKQEFRQAVENAEKELRPHAYANLPLAQKIYQSNLREVFNPLLEQIRSGRRSMSVIERIKQLDPEKLVTESEWQESAMYPIDGRILRKMIKDHSRVVEALESAARKRIELDETKIEWTKPSGEFAMFQDFSLLLESLDKTTIAALQMLLPDLWIRLQEGVRLAAKDQEARLHAK